MLEIRVTRKGAGRIASGHLWIFASDVEDPGEARGGEAVKVLDARGKPLGTAHYSSSSQIALRLLSPAVETVDTGFFLRRIRAAQALREKLVRGTNAYRAVFGEADLLPALVVDRYDRWLVAQTLNQGMDRAWPDILQALREVYDLEGVLLRNDVAVRQRENLPLEKKVAWGSVPERITIEMNGLAWEASLMHGQKTGIYLDQRENYLAAAKFAHGRALDAFTSSGGFALHLAPVCEHVEGVDSSEEAIAAAERNRDRNGIHNVSFREANAFDLLVSYAAAGHSYSTVVLDPPAFAKSRGNVEAAARGYKEINLRALRLLASGGVLVTCSCSHHMSEAGLLEIVAAASLDAGRRLRVLDRRTQAQDHPVLLTVPETHYLKCLVLEVV